MKIIKTLIEKLVFGGQGLGRINKKVVLAWNALPEEEVEVSILKRKKSYLEGIASKIIKESPFRTNPLEDHFLSCSPWQILKWEKENHWKKEIAKETFEKIGNLKELINYELVSIQDNQYNYRNKMEYSFTSNKNGKISLAFFKRGTHRLIPIDFCKLAIPEINEVAQKIIIWLNQNSVPSEILKSIVLRTNNKKQVIAGLFIKKNFFFKNYPPLQKPLIGFHIYFSNPLSPASVVDEELFKEGQNFLDINIRETTLKYGLLSFFQINLHLFEIALNDISTFLDPKKSLIDYYSGIVAISIPLNSFYKDCILIDSEQEAINYALENIKTNNLEDKCKVLKSLVEKSTQLIEKNKIILFDPPRAGLHKKIIKKILIEKPVRIIYLSCNLSTQARDIQLLQSMYKIKFLRLYNFFPRTPHIEGLCVLDRK